MKIKVTTKQLFFNGRCADCNKPVHKEQFDYDRNFADILPWHSEYVKEVWQTDFDPKTGLTIQGALIAYDDYKRETNHGIVSFTVTVPALIHPDDWCKYLTCKLDRKFKKLDESLYLSEKIVNDLSTSMYIIQSANFE